MQHAVLGKVVGVVVEAVGLMTNKQHIGGLDSDIQAAVEVDELRLSRAAADARSFENKQAMKAGLIMCN